MLPAANGERSDAHRHAGLHRPDDLVRMGGVVIHRQRGHDLHEIRHFHQLIGPTADDARQFNDRIERRGMLAQVLERLQCVGGHDREFVDLAVDVGPRHVFAADADRIDVLQRVGHPRDHREILAVAVARLAAIEVKHLDAGHAGHEPGMPAIDVDAGSTRPVPKLDSLRRRCEAAADKSPIEVHDAVVR